MAVKITYGGEIQALVEHAQPEVAVGVFAGEHPSSGDSLVDIALWNHEGTDTIPARPFIRIGLQSPRVREATERLGKAVLEGKTTPAQAMRLLGEVGRAEVVRAISAHIPPPNAPSTIAAKGSDTPLIDTGVLRSKIASKVRNV